MSAWGGHPVPAWTSFRWESARGCAVCAIRPLVGLAWVRQLASSAHPPLSSGLWCRHPGGFDCTAGCISSRDDSRRVVGVGRSSTDRRPASRRLPHPRSTTSAWSTQPHRSTPPRRPQPSAVVCGAVVGSPWFGDPVGHRSTAVAAAVNALTNVAGRPMRRRPVRARSGTGLVAFATAAARSTRCARRNRATLPTAG